MGRSRIIGCHRCRTPFAGLSDCISLPMSPVATFGGHAQGERLNRRIGAPNQRVAGVGHRSTGDTDLGFFLDL